MTNENEKHSKDEQPDRRQFIKGASCVIGAAIGAVPMAAGVRVVLSPLVDKEAAAGGAMIRLGDLGDLETGVPMKFAIVADKSDKWTRYKDVPVGAVYLVKQKEDAKEPVVAFKHGVPAPGLFCGLSKRETGLFLPVPRQQFCVEWQIEKRREPARNGHADSGAAQHHRSVGEIPELQSQLQE